MGIDDLDPIIDQQRNGPRDHPAGNHAAHTDHDEQGPQAAVDLIGDAGDHIFPAVAHPFGDQGGHESSHDQEGLDGQAEFPIAQPQEDQHAYKRGHGFPEGGLPDQFILRFCHLISPSFW